VDCVRGPLVLGRLTDNQGLRLNAALVAA